MSESNTTGPKMNCPSSGSKNESSDEPLFVLKYQKAKLVKRLIMFLPIFYMFGFGLTHMKSPFDLLVYALGLSCCSFVFINYLLFREVRLYKDRMVQTWNFIGKREIRLADAQLRCTVFATGTGRFKFGPYNKSMFVSRRRTNVIWAEIVGISYNEMLADPDDVKKLNALLAGLTGRRVEEFEQPRIRIDSLIQEEGR